MNKKIVTIKACPQCVDDKAMQANRKEKTYTCRVCGRTWRDERLEIGCRVIFTGTIRPTWHTDKSE